MPLSGIDRAVGESVHPACAEQLDAARAGDERGELIRRFGHWHDPIPAILSSAGAQSVLRTDIHELAKPLPAMHVGCVAMLGDAGLHAPLTSLGAHAAPAGYSRLRR